MKPLRLGERLRAARRERFRDAAEHERSERRTGALIGAVAGLASGALFGLGGYPFALTLPIGAALGLLLGWVFGPICLHFVVGPWW